MSGNYVLRVTVAIAGTILFSPVVRADIVLTFDQNPVGNATAVNQAYGDRVTSSPDGNGYQYDIISGFGLGTTPNVEVSYNALDPRIWTTGYGNLTNVFYDETDGSNLIEIAFFADSGFEVGLFGFDLAAFGAGLTVPGISVTDGNNNILWSVGPTFVPSGQNHLSIDFANGLFAQSLRFSVDLTGLGGASDNLGIDNVHFGQRAIPEPSSACILFFGLALAGFRGRRSIDR